MSEIVPVVLFAYDRPEHLRRTLACLYENQVPLIYAFSDGAATPNKTHLVEEVRGILKSIDWCEVILCERTENLGLGKSILTGVAGVLEKHEMCIVSEDDLIFVSGAYKYMTQALLHYRDDSRVMSIASWTHPMLVPRNVRSFPYFDGRACCLLWGIWARAWRGMNAHTATEYMQELLDRGRDPAEYGADLVSMAKEESKRNIWAVRLAYHHLIHNGLCMRPPFTMTQHVGLSEASTNCKRHSWADDAVLTQCPDIPPKWPEPILNKKCAVLWRNICGGRPSFERRIKVRLHWFRIMLNRMSLKHFWKRHVGRHGM